MSIRCNSMQTVIIRKKRYRFLNITESGPMCSVAKLRCTFPAGSQTSPAYNVLHSQKSRKKPQLSLQIIDICEAHLFEDDIFMIFLVWQILPTLYRVKKSHFVTSRLKIFFQLSGFPYMNVRFSVHYYKPFYLVARQPRDIRPASSISLDSLKPLEP